MYKARKLAWILCAWMVGLAAPARAQWMSQTVVLQPGWNAVYLQVQPQPDDCATLFAGTPVESVWGWSRRFSTVQYLQNPGDLVAGQPDWLVWGAGTNYRAAANLFHVQAERAYLIKVATNAAPFSLQIYGRPVVRTASWVADSFNLTGLHVDPTTPPTFATYFAPSAAHAGQPIFRLTAAGTWTQVNPATEKPLPGQAYWVRCRGASTYGGPLTVAVAQGRSLDYGRSSVEQTLTIQNNGTKDQVVTVTQLDSGPAPAGAAPAVAGGVPLSSFTMNYPTQVGFQPLNQTLSQKVPAGTTWSLRLAVRRPDMARPPAISTSTSYQSLLRITDGAGTVVTTPVTALGGNPLDVSQPVHTGLWVGTATIGLVSQGADPTNCPTCPIPTNTAAPFQFRLLVHQGTNGQANLLQQVSVGFKNGPGSNHWAGAQSGSYVLLTGNPTLQTNLYDSLVRRFASPAFGFTNPVPFSPANAAFGVAGTVLTSTVILPYNDPLNPFVHPYHPDHDNLDDAYNPLPVSTNANWPADHTVPGPATSESYTVTRYLTLQFTANDPDNLSLPGWGDTMIGGNYQETITGLHKNPLYIQGTFRLHLAVSAGNLN